MPSYLFDALRARALASPESTFCWIERGGKVETVTCSEIVAEADAFAGWLSNQGVKAGSVVALVLEPGRELYAYFIGAVFAGAVPTILAPLTRKQDPAIFRQGMRALLSRVEPTVTIVSAATAQSVDAAQAGLATLPVLSADPTAARGKDAPGQKIAFLQHSSGTTGLKKGVVLSHAAVLDQIERYSSAIDVNENDIVASWLPLYHDMGLITSFLMPVVKGIPIVTLDALEWSAKPTSILRVMSERRATLCWLPNFAFHHIARLVRPTDHFDLSSVRLIVSCSEPCRNSAFDAFMKACAPFGLRSGALQTSYAMAENVFAVTQSKPGNDVKVSKHPDYLGYLSSGCAIAATTIELLDKNGCAVEGREVGEIVVRSSSLFDGYHRLEGVTRERLRDGRLWTGDVGFMDGEDLFVVGRVDDMLHVNGKNIMAHEIEEALSQVEGITPGRVMAYQAYDKAVDAGQLGIIVEPFDGDGGPALATQIRKVVIAVAGVSPAEVHFAAQNFLVKSTAGKLSRSASMKKMVEHFHREPA